MEQQITPVIQVFEKNQYLKVIKPAFTELTVGTGSTPGTSGESVNTLPTISEFFQNYQDLFFQIPKEGETNSHQFLVNQSSEYIQGEAINQQITALTQEITNLRQENLELQQQLLSLTKTTGL
jgi:hypothetical protein